MWEVSVLSFAQGLFNTPTSDARSAAGAALREAYGLCKENVQCQSEVFQYFGVNATSYPPLGALGDINGAYNSILSQVGLGSSLGTSPAGALIRTYYGLPMCQVWKQQSINPKLSCPVK